MTDYTAKWGALISKTVDEQTKFFLHAFVLDFQGKFEQVLTQILFLAVLIITCLFQVLDIAEEFKNYAAPGHRASLKELGEFDCHLFLGTQLFTRFT